MEYLTDQYLLFKHCYLNGTVIVVVAKLAKRSLPTPGDLGSNPSIRQFLWQSGRNSL